MFRASFGAALRAKLASSMLVRSVIVAFESLYDLAAKSLSRLRRSYAT